MDPAAGSIYARPAAALLDCRGRSWESGLDIFVFEGLIDRDVIVLRLEGLV